MTPTLRQLFFLSYTTYRWAFHSAAPATAPPTLAECYTGCVLYETGLFGVVKVSFGLNTLID